MGVTGFPLEFTAVIDRKTFDTEAAAITAQLKSVAAQNAAQQKASNDAQRAYAALIMQTGSAFKSVDQGVQNQIRNMVQLTTQMSTVKDAQSQLSEKFQNGQLGLETYTNTMAGLVAEENRLSAAIANSARDLTFSDGVMRAGLGSITQKTLQLQKLKQQYEELTEADRNSAVGSKLKSEFHQLDQELQQISRDFLEVNRNALGSINEKSAQLQKLKNDYLALSEADRKNNNIGKPLLNNIRAVDAEVQKLNRDLSNIQEPKGLAAFASSATAALAGYATFTAGTNFIKDIVRVRGEFQQLETAFKTMLGSKEKADKLLAQATQLAAKTPFTLQEVGQGTKQLLAYGFAADKVVGNLKMLGDIAAGVGVPLNDLTYLYGTLRTQGTAMTKDIREFAGRGIPIIKALSDQFKINEEQVFEYAEASKISFKDVEKAFQSMSGAGGMFFNLTSEQAKTLTGLTSNLGDAWARMLNDIGKSNEGALASSLKGATVLVDNYEKVIDILKVLVIVYGSYRAALIAEATLTSIATARKAGWTTATLLQYQASLLAERGMKALNLALAISPTVAITAAIAALVAVIYGFTQTTSAAAEAAKAFADISVESAKAMNDERVNLEELQKAAQSKLVTDDQRAEAVAKLRGATGEYLKHLSDEQIILGQGKPIIEEYIKQLGRRTEAETALAKIKYLQNQAAELDIKGIDAVGTFEKLAMSVKAATGFGDYSKQGYFNQLFFGDAQSEAIVNQKKKSLLDAADQIRTKYSKDIQDLLTGGAKTGSSAGPTDAQKRTLAVIDEQIKKEKERQQKETTNRKEFMAIQVKINALEREREAITGRIATKAGAKELTQKQQDLQQLLKDINTAEADARASGLLKEESEIAKINRKYDELKKKAQELKAGAGVLTRIENARTLETGNELEKQQAAKYEQTLQDQKDKFEEFEKLKTEFGLKEAERLMEGQLGMFDSYIDFLKGELGNLAEDPSLSARISSGKVATELAAAEKKAQKDATENQKKEYARLFADTLSLNRKKIEVEKKYERDLAGLRANFKGDDLKERERELKAARDQELADIQSNLARQSNLYKKLNTDIIGLTKDQIKKYIQELRKIKEDGFFKDDDGNKVFLTPQMIADLDSAIDGVVNLKNQTDKVVQGASEAAKQFSNIGSILGNLAQAIEPFNKKLAQAVSQVSDMANVAASAAQSIAGFASGDYAAGAAGAASALTGIITAFANAKARSRAAEDQARSFQLALLQGEIDINALYRERARTQAAMQANRISGLKEEAALLEQQKKQIQANYQTIFAQIAKETYTISEEEKKKRGLGVGFLLGAAGMLFGSHKEVETTTGSLVGKSFDDLEKLFLSGQLSDKAKDLFQTLQRLKQEGADIDAMLEENKRKAQEMFTGTTADSLIDSILNGFREGKRSAADFADFFQEQMKNAVLQALKFQALEEPLKAFYEEFAANSASDGVLTAGEIEELKKKFTDIIGNAATKFEDLKKITDLDFSATAGGGATSPNSLSGAIRGITEQQADLLAGQFGGLRLTAIDQLKMATQSLGVLQEISFYTQNLITMNKTLTDFKINGIKLA